MLRAKARSSDGPILHSLSIADVPPELVCPLTLDVFRDPVLAVGDGCTYERTEIERWFGSGERRSPVTNEPIEQTSVVANRIARTMIQRLSS